MGAVVDHAVTSRAARPPVRMDGRSTRLGGEDGYTLVELLVAMSVFGVVLTAVTAAFISSARSIGDQRLRTAATRLATDRLETLRTAPFDALDAQAGVRTTSTAHGRQFATDTEVVPVDPATGQPAVDGGVKQVTARVSWTSGGATRQVSFTTGVTAGRRGPSEPLRAIGMVAMFPSPATTDAGGRALHDVEVTVPLTGFAATTLVHLAWSNADGTAGAKTLTSATGVNWRGTVAKEQLRATVGVDGRGEVQFRVSAGDLSAVYGLATHVTATSAPVITAAGIDRTSIVVAAPSRGRGCDGRNVCQNTTHVTFPLLANGLDTAHDYVIVHYQLFDGTFQELPLAPVAGQWRATVRQSTAKFLVGTARSFRFTAIRSADGATAATTVSRDVVTT